MRKRLLKFLVGAAIFAVPIGFALGILRLMGETAVGVADGIAAGLGGTFCALVVASLIWIITGKGIDDLLHWMER